MKLPRLRLYCFKTIDSSEAGVFAFETEASSILMTSNFILRISIEKNIPI